MRQAPANLKGGRAARWTSPAATIYLSIVVEFENGRGIGCHWKIGTVAGLQLPVPAPARQDREFHVVVRSGTAEVGARLCEDYSPYIRPMEQVRLGCCPKPRQGSSPWTSILKKNSRRCAFLL